MFAIFFYNSLLFGGTLIRIEFCGTLIRIEFLKNIVKDKMVKCLVRGRHHYRLDSWNSFNCSISTFTMLKFLVIESIGWKNDDLIAVFFNSNQFSVEILLSSCNDI